MRESKEKQGFVTLKILTKRHICDILQVVLKRSKGGVYNEKRFKNFNRTNRYYNVCSV